METLLRPTPERIEARKKEKARFEREMMRPYTLEDHYFMANKADAAEIDGAVPFEGERYNQPTEDNGLEMPDGAEIITVYLKSKTETPFPYIKLCIEADDLKDFWLPYGVKTSVKKLFEKPKKKVEKKEEKKDK